MPMLTKDLDPQTIKEIYKKLSEEGKRFLDRKIWNVLRGQLPDYDAIGNPQQAEPPTFYGKPLHEAMLEVGETDPENLTVEKLMSTQNYVTQKELNSNEDLTELVMEEMQKLAATFTLPKDKTPDKYAGWTPPKFDLQASRIPPRINFGMEYGINRVNFPTPVSIESIDLGRQDNPTRFYLPPEEETASGVNNARLLIDPSPELNTPTPEKPKLEQPPPMLRQIIFDEDDF